MLRILKRLVGAEHREEVAAAIADAEQSIAQAEARTPEIERLVNRVQDHGRRNHFGERYEALARRLTIAPEAGQ